MNEKDYYTKIINKEKLCLDTLLEAPRSCIYALKNDQDKRIQLFCTTNFSQHLSRIIEESRNSIEYKIMYEDRFKVILEILETNPDRDLMHHKLNEYIEKYKEKGYSLYKDIAVTKYSFYKSITYVNGKAYYMLELVSPNKSKRIVLGLFEKHKDLLEFKDKHYPNEQIRAIIKK